MEDPHGFQGRMGSVGARPPQPGYLGQRDPLYYVDRETILIHNFVQRMCAGSETAPKEPFKSLASRLSILTFSDSICP